MTQVPLREPRSWTCQTPAEPLEHGVMAGDGVVIGQDQVAVAGAPDDDGADLEPEQGLALSTPHLEFGHPRLPRRPQQSIHDAAHDLSRW